jgi:hypothetical protein
MAIGPYSLPSVVDTLVVGEAFTPPYSLPSTVNTAQDVGVPVPLPPFSLPSTVSTASTSEWQLSVTGSTVGASLSAS